MENGEEKSDDFYAVLGLKKECTASELRNAYKKLALRWHPDRCSASGNSKFVEEAKKKFQAIQRAYSVLSDANKRFLYDVGIYDSDDDENGMGDFLNEMAVMMTQTKSNEKGEESFEELQELFEELFQSDIGSSGSSSQTTTCSSSSSSYSSYCETSGSSNKRNSSEMNCGKTNLEDTSASGFDANFQDFCFGAEQRRDARKQRRVRGVPGGGGRRSWYGKKLKFSSDHTNRLKSNLSLLT
ncbi:hypothetical protein F2P56_016260 [Juglans regia]|uniref:J domain-containing protein n=2 Tax=Juglans regia TaxID=51240 RepID=A0A834CWA2_JUGRE|nr:dnaJ homolog subfamily B member 6-like isoform X1 [Juglans regia]KAF5466323.1 hypothetical protein F2P56_016260 [Juglans regia]